MMCRTPRPSWKSAALLALLAAAGCGRSMHVEILASTPAIAPGAAWDVEQAALDKAVAQALRPGWRVVVAPISDRSLTEEPLASLELPNLSAWGLTEGQFTKNVLPPAEQQARKAMLALRTRGTSKKRTEIIAAIDAASDRFAEDAQRERLLVVLSTSYEQSSFLNTGDYRLNLGDAEQQRIINHLKAVGAFPHLAGVRVCMAGITSGKDNWADPIRARNLKQFWKRFFSEAGAALVLYDVSLDGCGPLFLNVSIANRT